VLLPVCTAAMELKGTRYSIIWVLECTISINTDIQENGFELQFKRDLEQKTF
jgi:hypothetical protein